MSYEATTTDSSTYVSFSQLEDKLAAAQKQVEEERKARNYLYAQQEERAKALKELIVEQHENIDEDIIQSLCEIFDIEVEEEVTLDVTIEMTATVKRPIWESNNDRSIYVDSVKLSIEKNYGEDIDWTIVDYNVDSVTIDNND